MSGHPGMEKKNFTLELTLEMSSFVIQQNLNNVTQIKERVSFTLMQTLQSALLQVYLI